MQRINVTKTFLPPQEEYDAYVKGIWERDWLTNQGQLILELEQKLAAREGVPNLQVVANGTLALQLALKSLDINDGEVITTPFSYVATTSAILWQNCQPVFVDIEPDTFCIDPAKIEAAITPRTKAILPVHVFGNACDVERIHQIADKHGLKVIYDAAHAFGASYGGKSLVSYGDISICSFHATKVFHTIEGGALIAKDPAVAEKIDLLKRFGHTGDEHFMLGINAKASEFHAAMGLANLKYIESNIAARKQIYQEYAELLPSGYRRPLIRDGETYNYAYYPLLLESEAELKRVTAALNAQNVYPRRYFYPSLNKLPYIRPAQSLPISEDIALRILCLPLYTGLMRSEIEMICQALPQK